MRVVSHGRRAQFRLTYSEEEWEAVLAENPEVATYLSEISPGATVMPSDDLLPHLEALPGFEEIDVENEGIQHLRLTGGAADE